MLAEIEGRNASLSFARWEFANNNIEDGILVSRFNVPKEDLAEFLELIKELQRVRLALVGKTLKEKDLPWEFHLEKGRTDILIASEEDK